MYVYDMYVYICLKKHLYRAIYRRGVRLYVGNL